MNIFARHKNILLTIIGLILVFFGYWYFVLSKKGVSNQKNATGGGLVKTNDATPSAVAGSKSYDKEFVAGLLNLNTINLDVSIFESLAYKALSFPEQPFAVDYNIPYGRQNPFLPIGVDAVGISTSITTQTASDLTDTVDAASSVSTTSPVTPMATTTPVKPTQKTFPTNTKR